mmetsp:Transcript_29878/g.95693  ORF Transcript_29878/g.95693 Transcript_29878/m.95693 type:complete len:89 (+) Transcript_29878:317-583(+)
MEELDAIVTAPWGLYCKFGVKGLQFSIEGTAETVTKICVQTTKKKILCSANVSKGMRKVIMYADAKEFRAVNVILYRESQRCCFQSLL